jgi:hypothetical protein
MRAPVPPKFTRLRKRPQAICHLNFLCHLDVLSFVIFNPRKAGLSHRNTRIYLHAMRSRLISMLAMVSFCFAGVAAEPAKETGTTKDLFNGKDLSGWKKTEFGGEGEVEVKDGKIITHEGASLSGVNYTNALPARIDYQITLEAMKIDGDDFFCGLTFPYKDTHCTFIVGGWGGGVVGLSSIDGMDASENDSTKYIKFEKNKWYKIKVEVRPDRIKAWIDDDKMADAETTDHKIDLRAGGIELQKPLGLATYQTTAAWRNIKFTTLPPAKKD